MVTYVLRTPYKFHNVLLSWLQSWNRPPFSGSPQATEEKGERGSGISHVVALSLWPVSSSSVFATSVLRDKIAFHVP